MRRRAHRLPAEFYYDRWVFVTIVLAGRLHLFGEVVDGELMHSELGLEADRRWRWLERVCDGLRVGPWVVMPDHVHVLLYVPQDSPFGRQVLSRGGIARNPVGEAILLYKSRLTNVAHRKGQKVAWVSRYHDTILQSEQDYDTVAKYIMDNPRKWWEKYGNPGRS